MNISSIPPSVYLKIEGYQRSLCHAAACPFGSAFLLKRCLNIEHVGNQRKMKNSFPPHPTPRPFLPKFKRKKRKAA